MELSIIEFRPCSFRLNVFLSLSLFLSSLLPLGVFVSNLVKPFQGICDNNRHLHDCSHNACILSLGNWHFWQFSGWCDCGANKATDAAFVVDRYVFSSKSCAVKVSNEGGSEVAREELLTAVPQETNSGPNPIIKMYTRHLLAHIGQAMMS